MQATAKVNRFKVALSENAEFRSIVWLPLCGNSATSENDKHMATKLFTSTLSLFTLCGMAESEARFMARLANGHAQSVGIADVTLDDADAKSTSKGFTTSIKATHKRTLTKGQLLTLGEVAWLFAVQVNALNKAFPGTINGLSIPTGLSKAYKEAMERELTEAKEKAEAEAKAKLAKEAEAVPTEAKDETK